MRNTRRAIVPDFGEHLLNFVIAGQDFDGQVGADENRSDLVRESLHADIGDAVTIVAQADCQR